MAAQKICTEASFATTTPLEYSIKHDFLKRSFDIVFSLLVLIFFSPFFLLIALCIRLNSRGPIFYAQERVARGGNTFKCLKFRTMCINADEMLHKILQENPELRKEWTIYFKLKNDPRITSFGKFLRKTSLDEFPQFWNVLKGDLSVVGPRPFVQEEVTKYLQNKAPKILSIRPGITGAWQVSGRSNLSMEERVRIEETYVDTRNFWKDLGVILKTVPVMLFSKGAY